MNIFIIHKSIAKQYMALHNKIRYNKRLREYAKSGLVICAFLFWLALYIFYVNKASTLGYFYRTEQQKRDSVLFNYNIQSFETTKTYEALWESIMTGNKYLGSDSNTFSIQNTIYPIE